MTPRFLTRIEWPTVALIAACYAAWFALATIGHGLPVPLWIVLAGLVTTLFWSIVHEVVHGHPTTSATINYAMIWLPLGWTLPNARFRDLHIEHHETGALTDPFDDPESWYLDPTDWMRRSRLAQAVLSFNNTLAGRMLIGPAINIWRAMAGDLSNTVRSPKQRSRILVAWTQHAIAVAVLAWLVAQLSAVPWQFAAAAYFGISVLLIRTFLEHQASPEDGERTVIIEDRGPLAFLFLFNNLHVVHHTRPGLAWYYLPGFYARHRERFIRRNNGYVYPNYRAIFARYFLTAKEPVPYPLSGAVSSGR